MGLRKREEAYGYWPIALATARKEWKVSSPLKRFLMLNTHLIWDNGVYLEWILRDGVEAKAHLLKHSWAQLAIVPTSIVTRLTN